MCDRFHEVPVGTRCFIMPYPDPFQNARSDLSPLNQRLRATMLKIPRCQENVCCGCGEQPVESIFFHSEEIDVISIHHVCRLCVTDFDSRMMGK